MRGKTRTAKQKEKIFRSLKPYFKLGYSLNKACVSAKIPTSTAHDIINEKEELRIEMESLQNFVSHSARKVITDKIVKDKDAKLSQWWLERQEKDDFSQRVESKNESEHHIHASNFDMAELRHEVAKRSILEEEGLLPPIVYPDPDPKTVI